MTAHAALLAQFEREQLNSRGCYVGLSLLAWGFPYPIGRFVPAHLRPGAALQHRWAMQARRIMEVMEQ